MRIENENLRPEYGSGFFTSPGDLDQVPDEPVKEDIQPILSELPPDDDKKPGWFAFAAVAVVCVLLIVGIIFLLKALKNG